MMKSMIVAIGLFVLLLPTTATAAPQRQTDPAPAACATAVAAAVSRVGRNYVWGAKGANEFDCSGLIYWAYAQAGIDVGQSTYDQQFSGAQISCQLSDLNGTNTTCWQPGDLVFARYSGGQHVAMYIGDGLFVDAYNTSTGVIVHAIQSNSFYLANYWQARRIVDCGGTGGVLASDIPTPSTAISAERLPPLLGYVAWTIPQCGSCNADGSGALLPYVAWADQWPAGWDALNLPEVVRVTASWVAWNVAETIRQMLCWLINVAAQFAAILSGFANVLIAGINGLFHLGIVIWLGARAWMFGVYLQIVAIVQGIAAFDVSSIIQFFLMIRDFLWMVFALIGQIVILVVMLFLSWLGMITWIGALIIGALISIRTAMGGTSTPIQIGGTSPIYEIVRGTLDGVMASQLGWIINLMIAMCYVAFVFWLSRYFSSSEA